MVLALFMPHQYDVLVKEFDRVYYTCDIAKKHSRGATSIPQTTYKVKLNARRVYQP